jgi:protein phosphatase
MTPRNPAAHFDSAAATHVGKVRSCNEDSYLARPEVGIWAVADGMGGHRAGDFASQTIVGELSQIKPTTSAALLLQACQQSLIEANGHVRAAANSQALGVVGSTVAVLLTFGRHFAYLWCGDSRIYLVRNGAITQLTRDHTEVQELLQQGILTEAEAQRWPRQQVITRAVGVADQVELEQNFGELRPGDIFVLCSDGLTAHVQPNEILLSVRADTATNACRVLIDLTLERGAVDNVTIIVVRFVPERDTAVGSLPPDVWE